MATKIFALALAFASALVLALGGCKAGACARHSDCSAGQICGRAGLCETAPDGGHDTDDNNDGGVTDAPVDATTSTFEDAAIDGGL